jgi:hypothetical protein
MRTAGSDGWDGVHFAPVQRRPECLELSCDRQAVQGTGVFSDREHVNGLNNR